MSDREVRGVLERCDLPVADGEKMMQYGGDV